MAVSDIDIHLTVLPLLLRGEQSISTNEHVGTNILTLPTDYTINYPTYKIVNWIGHLLGIGTNSGKLKEFIVKQQHLHNTCAQFSFCDNLDMDDDNCHEIDGFCMHRRNGERVVLPFTIRSNNREQFEEWCADHKEALRLNLTDPAKIHHFRSLMDLKAVEHDPVLDDQSNQLYTTSLSKMYTELIHDCEEKFKLGLSPMNDSCMMIACYYAMTLASPDIHAKREVKAGSLDTNDFLCSPAFEGMTVSQTDILNGYHSMVTSKQSPINKIVPLRVYSLVTSETKDGRDAVSSLHEISSIVVLASSSPTRVSLLERLESLFIAINSLPDNCNAIAGEDCSRSFSEMHWLVKGRDHNLRAPHNIFTTRAFIDHLTQADFSSLKTLSEWTERNFNVSLPCKPNVDNLIKCEQDLQLYPIGRTIDYREMNCASIGVPIWRLMYHAVNNHDLAQDNDHRSSIPQLIQCLQDCCGTVWHHNSTTGIHHKDPTSRATIAILMMYDAAQCLNEQQLLLKCFTRANDSDSPGMSLKDEVLLLGKTLCFCFLSQICLVDSNSLFIDHNSL